MPILEQIVVYGTILLVLICIFGNKTNTRQVFRNLLEWLLQVVKILITPKLLMTFGIAWFITNGWSYFILVLGEVLHNDIMLWIGGSYQAFLWFPLSMEKVITVAIALWLAKWFFPNDLKLQKHLHSLNPKNILKK